MKPFPEEVTIGDKYSDAMKVQTAEEAAEYLEACIEHTMRCRPEIGRDEATAIEKQNIGYFAGYCNSETYDRVMRLFNTQHPIFGSRQPTAEAAFELGKRMGSKTTDGSLVATSHKEEV